MSGNILILAEIQNQTIASTFEKVLTASRLLKGESLDVIVFGSQEQAEILASFKDISSVFVIENTSPTAENVSGVVLSLLEKKSYSHVLADSSTFGKKVLPRVAGLRDVMQISDVMQILSPDIFVRPLYAGNAVATVRSSDRLKVMTVRSSCFEVTPQETRTDKAPVHALAFTPSVGGATLINQEWNTSNRPDLGSAKVVISGGRALGSAENFALLEPCADLLNAAIGATRAAVDSGYISNDHQVGQTGKVVSPELYIGVGISGAIQHIAGMRNSKVIAAINTDPDAPLCQMADVVLVQDLFTALPELEKKLRE